MLFKGQDDELFMIFNPSKVNDSTLKPEDKSQWKLGVLELDPPSDENFAMPHHHYEERDAFDEIYQLDDKIVSKILDQTPGGRVKGNPTIFKRKTTVLVVPLKNQLQMLELEEDKMSKIFKIFDRGELFIGYNEDTD